MTLRRVVPLVVGLVAVAATVAAILMFGDDDAFVAADDDGRDGPAFTEPEGDGTFRCSANDAPDAPRVSVPTGFHAEPFDVELVADVDGTIVYTLDGSYPDPIDNADATHEYGEPLPIATNEGPYPLTALRSAFDREQLAQRRSSPAVWNVTHDETDGGMVVRARVVSDDEMTSDATDAADAEGDAANGDAGADADAVDGDAAGDAAADADGERDVPPPGECVAVYFVGEHLVRSELPVTHLAVSQDHLFDHETGIYLPGSLFEDYLDSDGFNAQWAEQFGLVPANYRERGREWERPFEDRLEDAVVMHHFDPGGEVAYTSNLGIRAHGGWTRAFPQKSLRLYARNDYGNRTFQHDFFGEDGPDVHRRLVLRNSGNDWEWTMLLDGYVQTLIHHLDIDTQAYQPTALFINGEYWGLHNLRERYDRHYLEVAHGVDPDNVAIITGYGPCCEVSTGEEGDEEPYEELLFALQEMDPTDPATLEYIESQVDLDNLIDYLAIQLYVSNTDWPQNNLEFWREKVDPDPSIGSARDGRWRWLVYDLDFVGDLRRDHFHDPFERLGEMVDESDPLADLGIPFLFDRLVQNDGFREAFATRFADLANTAFESDRSIAELDRLIDLLGPEMEHHIDRWGNSMSSNWWPAETPMRWHERLGEVRRFFTERPGVVRHFASEYLGLGGAVALTITVDDGSAGSDGGAEGDGGEEGGEGAGGDAGGGDGGGGGDGDGGGDGGDGGDGDGGGDGGDPASAGGHVVVNTIDIVAGTPGVDDPTAWTGRYYREVPVTLRAVAADGYRFVGWYGLPADSEASGDDGEVVVLNLDDDLSVTAIFEPA